MLFISYHPSRRGQCVRVHDHGPVGFAIVEGIGLGIQVGGGEQIPPPSSSATCIAVVVIRSTHVRPKVSVVARHLPWHTHRGARPERDLPLVLGQNENWDIGVVAAAGDGIQFAFPCIAKARSVRH
jgi:hypothetical protein